MRPLGRVCDMSLRGVSATKQSPIPGLLRGVYPERSRRAHHERGKCSNLNLRPEPVEGSEYDVFQSESV